MRCKTGKGRLLNKVCFAGIRGKKDFVLKQMTGDKIWTGKETKWI
jgi:hypothetical protein